jgi:hypothetical protein
MFWPKWSKSAALDIFQPYTGYIDHLRQGLIDFGNFLFLFLLEEDT